MPEIERLLPVLTDRFQHTTSKSIYVFEQLEEFSTEFLTQSRAPVKGAVGLTFQLAMRLFFSQNMISWELMTAARFHSDRKYLRVFEVLSYLWPADASTPKPAFLGESIFFGLPYPPTFARSNALDSGVAIDDMVHLVPDTGGFWSILIPEKDIIDPQQHFFNSRQKNIDTCTIALNPMTVPRTFGLGARSSTLRICSRAVQERTVLYRRVSTKAAAAPAGATTARAPVAATTAPQTTQSVLSKTRLIAPSSKLLPISVPGRAGLAIQTFFVDTPAQVAEVTGLLQDPALPKVLYTKLECTHLAQEDPAQEDVAQEGSISLLILFSPFARQAFVLDVLTLKEAAFKTRGSYGFNIERILRSNNYRKIFFDIRGDSAALYRQFNIKLRDVEDIQLMQSVARVDGPLGTLRNLESSLRKLLDYDELAARTELRRKVGKGMFLSESRDYYAALSKRPLSPEHLANCVGEVYYLPRLRGKMWNFLPNVGIGGVISASQARVKESQQNLSAARLEEVREIVGQ